MKFIPLMAFFVVFIAVSVHAQMAIWEDTKKTTTPFYSIESPREVTDCYVMPRGSDVCNAYFVIRNNNKLVTVTKDSFIIDWLKTNPTVLDYTLYSSAQLMNVTTCHNAVNFDAKTKTHSKIKICDTKEYLNLSDPDPLSESKPFPKDSALYVKVKFSVPKWGTNSFNFTFDKATPQASKLDPDIGSCPRIINESGVYTLNTSISSQTACILINANDVILDCAGYSINHSNTSASFGIKFGQSNITIKNCSIYETELNSGSTGIYATASADVVIMDSYIYSNLPPNEFANYCLETSYNNNLKNSRVTCVNGGWYMEGATNIYIESFNSTPASYQNQGIYGYGNVGVDLNNSNIDCVGGRVGDGQGGALVLLDSNSGWRIYNSNFSNLAEASSIIIDGSGEVYINKSIINLYGTDASSGIHIKSGSNTIGIYNTIVNKSSAGSSNYGVDIVSGANIILDNLTIDFPNSGSNDDSGVGHLLSSLTDLTINNSKISMNCASGCLGIRIYNPFDNILIDNTNVITRCTGNYAGYFQGGTNLEIMKSNFTATNAASLGAAYFESTNYSRVDKTIFNSSNNKMDVNITDCKLMNFTNSKLAGSGKIGMAGLGRASSINLTNTTFNRTGTYWKTTDGGNITVNWYASINVTNASNKPVMATINITNSLNDLIFYNVTNSSGITNVFFVRDLWMNRTNTINYNPYSFTANLSGYLPNLTYRNITGSIILNLTLTLNLSIMSWNETPQNLTKEYLVPISYQVNATSTLPLDSYFINDTSNFQINATDGTIQNKTTLLPRVYWLNILVNDTSNNILNSKIFISITGINCSYTNLSCTEASVIYENATIYSTFICLPFNITVPDNCTSVILYFSEPEATNVTALNLSNPSIIPMINSYIPIIYLILLLALAILCIVIGFYIDFTPIEVFGWVVLFISGLMLLSGNVIHFIQGLTFVQFNDAASHITGLVMMFAAVGGSIWLWSRVRNFNAQETD